MEIATGKNKIDPAYLTGSLSYQQYKELIHDLLKENKVTGPVQSEALVAYTKLNVHRMHRIEKTMQLLPDVKEVMEQIKSPQHWLVITEGWCGDAAQIVPMLNILASLNPQIAISFLLRDENPELIDNYLTNGSRSIPKLIAVNPANMDVLFSWGPRPAYLQNHFYQMKLDGISFDVMKEEIHRWYAKDRTYTTQQEISAIFSNANNNASSILPC